MKLVYLAGPYSGPTHDYKSYETISYNISMARSVAIECAKHQVAYYCPHLNSAHFEISVPDLPVEYWYNMDLRIANACDGLLLFGAWRSSRGAVGELQHFQDAGKPVFEYREVDLEFPGFMKMVEWSRDET